MDQRRGLVASFFDRENAHFSICSFTSSIFPHWESRSYQSDPHLYFSQCGIPSASTGSARAFLTHCSDLRSKWCRHKILCLLGWSPHHSPARFFGHILSPEGFIRFQLPSLECQFPRVDPHPNIRELWNSHSSLSACPVLSSLSHSQLCQSPWTWQSLWATFLERLTNLVSTDC